ncbi:MAG: MFS transporter [Gammaproteobacteria bacterium]|nr:MFS transporter [Gammaproteobacteria bacterium]
MRDARFPSERRQAYSWAFCDWANSAFATTVLAGFFPLFFKQYWSADSDVTVSTFQLGMANSAASVLIALMSPLLGAIADRSSAKKRYLILFTGLGVVMTGCLALVAAGEWPVALAVFVLANIGFAGNTLFTDALLLDAAPSERLDRVSALGYALGYLGGGLLFALNVAMTLWPQRFGLPDAATAVRVSFVTVAVWWTVFTVPLMVSFREAPGARRDVGWAAVRSGLEQLWQTCRAVGELRNVLLFLIAFWCYIDGVHTVIRMAVDYGLSIGLAHEALITALLVTQFVGFPAAIVFGRLGERIGPKAGIGIALLVYTGACAWGYLMQEAWEFYVLAVAIGLVQGGVQSLSRSLFGRLVPRGRAGEFYGFYNLLGRFAAIIGPFLMGVVGLATGNPRLSILAVIALFVIGGALLLKVDERRAPDPALDGA